MNTKMENIHENMNREEEKKGFKIHRTVYFCVMSLLTVINLLTCPGFLWFIFPLVGMGIGVVLHYFLAIKGKLN